jgi:hypothetical protein
VAARTSLAAQVLLGVALTSGGYAGRPSHQFAALAAVVASWWAAGRGRTPRDHVIGCAITCALALAAYLLGRS